MHDETRATATEYLVLYFNVVRRFEGAVCEEWKNGMFEVLSRYEKDFIDNFVNEWDKSEASWHGYRMESTFSFYYINHIFRDSIYHVWNLLVFL